MIASARLAPSPVPTSVAVATAIDIASGGESKASATPAMTASSVQASVGSGAGDCSRGSARECRGKQNVRGGCLSDPERDGRQANGHASDERGQRHVARACCLLANEQA